MGILESIGIDLLDLGDEPVRLGGIKVYESREDNLMTEGVLIFGSGMRLRVNIRVRIPGTGYALNLPIEVKDIQVRLDPVDKWIASNHIYRAQGCVFELSSQPYPCVYSHLKIGHCCCPLL